MIDACGRVSADIKMNKANSALNSKAPNNSTVIMPMTIEVPKYGTDFKTSALAFILISFIIRLMVCIECQKPK